MSRPDRDGTKIRIGRDTGQDPRPEIFSGRDSGQGSPVLVPSRRYMYYIIKKKNFPYTHTLSFNLILSPKSKSKMPSISVPQSQPLTKAPPSSPQAKTPLTLRPPPKPFGLRQCRLRPPTIHIFGRKIEDFIIIHRLPM